MKRFMTVTRHTPWIQLCAMGALAVLIGLLPLKARAADAGDLFSQGNRAYAEGKYDEALSSYQAVLEKEGFSASLLYNMANAYYQKRDVARAILNYERALYLDPGDPDIRANLILAKREFGLTPEPQAQWKAPFNILNLNQWTWLASIAMGGFCLIFLLRGVAPKTLPGKWQKGVAVAFLVLAVVSSAGVIHQHRGINRGVITGDNPMLRVSPFDSAASSAQIRDGAVVRIAKAYKDFVFVKCPEGNAGWITKEAVEPVVPSEGWERRAT
jgi:hypothetical protein